MSLFSQIQRSQSPPEFVRIQNLSTLSSVLRKQLWVALAVILVGGMLTAAPFALREQNWDFESEELHEIAAGFETETGPWEVMNDGDNLIFAQLAENRDAVLNVTLNEETSYKNIELTVRIKPMAGENEGGGGLIWCARDRQNYYAVLYNPFVSRHKRTKPYLCLYKVENGKRTQLDHANVEGEVLGETLGEAPRETDWHSLKITMFGNRIYGCLDGERLLQADDDTFVDVGRIGLITKSDARTYFDDLRVTTLNEREND